MAEWENSKIFKSSYAPDLNGTRLDLYRLLNQFLASKSLSDLCKEDSWLNHAMYSLDNFFEIEATRILLSSAVTARVLDDRDKDLINYDTRCGTLINNLTKPEETADLSLREACNKIIHAHKINYDVVVGRQGYDQRYFNPIIYYYGTFKGKEWKATLNIVDYVRAYTDNIVE